MNVLEAAMSGRPIKRKTWCEWIFLDNDGAIAIDRHELLADDWEIKEPAINITADDVGRRIRLRCGKTELITGFHPGVTYQVRCSKLYHKTNGKCLLDNANHPDDIVELLP